MLRLAKKITKRQLLLIFISIAFVTLQVWLDLKIPDYMNEITKLIQTKGTTIKDILNPGFYMILCAFGSLLSSVIVGYFASYIAASFAYKLRKDIAIKINKNSDRTEFIIGKEFFSDIKFTINNEEAQIYFYAQN